jgi:hypothetical protein
MLFGHAARDCIRLLAREARQRLEDVPAPAVIRRDRQRKSAIASVSARRFDQRADLEIERARVADDLEADLVAVELAHFARERRDEQLHQQRDFVGGRRQFSELNANSVRKPTPRSAQAAHAPHRLDPRLCPAKRGRWRRRAQRPLPSRMMATWRGTLAGLRNLECRAQRAVLRVIPPSIPLLLLQQLVDLRDVLIGELLHLVLRAALVVLRDLPSSSAIPSAHGWRRAAGCGSRCARSRLRGARPW